MSLEDWLMLVNVMVDWGTLVFALVYLYMGRNFSYWKDKGVPCLTPLPLIGNLWRLLSVDQSPGVFVQGLHQLAANKPYLGFYIFDRPALILRDPALLQHILIKDFRHFTDRLTSSREDQDPLGATNLFCAKGARWRHVRINLTSTFSSGRLKSLFQRVLDSAAQTRNYIHKNIGKPINVKDLFMRTSLDTSSSCLLGIRSNTVLNREAQFRHYGAKMMRWTPIRALEILALFFVPALVRVSKAMLFQRECTAFLTEAFKESLGAREVSGATGCDLMDLLVRLKKQSHIEDNGSGFSEDEVLAQAMVFFVAGFETSSSTMSFAFYEIAISSDIQNKLRTEIQEVLTRYDGEVTYEAVQEMTYLDMVVSETLRKYPPLPFFDRVCNEDYFIPGADVKIEKGTPVFASLLGLHRDPEYYTSPLTFDPERFSKERKADIITSTYMPFGVGPRHCPGMRFGLLSVKLILVQVLQGFRVALHMSTPVPLELSPYVLFLKNIGHLPLVFLNDNLAENQGIMKSESFDNQSFISC